LATTAASGKAGSKVSKPATRAARLRAMPDASATSTTGAESHLAISAVEPSSPDGDAPSKSPMTPSMTAISALLAACVKVSTAAVRPMSQPSRLWLTLPVARW
jgi:hypothetical protein